MPSPCPPYVTHACVLGSLLDGLSVDFVIHIGHGYMEAVWEGQERGTTRTRGECARQSVATMGFPVLSAGVTTLMSAIVLFFCQAGAASHSSTFQLNRKPFLSLESTRIIGHDATEIIGPGRRIWRVCTGDL